MGSGSSTASAGVEVVSPRIEMTKDGPRDIILDSVALADVGHGTIRYRYETPGPSVHDSPGQDKKSIPTGYFFHQKLKDYSVLNDPANEEAYKFVKVASGPRKHKNETVYYVTGLGFKGTNDEMPPALISKNSKHSKKIYGHMYFVVSCDASECDIADCTDEVVSLSETDGKMLVSSSDTVKDVKRRLGHHFLCPLGIIHALMTSDEELSDDRLMSGVFKDDIVSSTVITLRFSLQK